MASVLRYGMHGGADMTSVTNYRLQGDATGSGDVGVNIAITEDMARDIAFRAFGGACAHRSTLPDDDDDPLRPGAFDRLWYSTDSAERVARFKRRDRAAYARETMGDLFVVATILLIAVTIAALAINALGGFHE